ncbi:type II toxin-antitoxin system HicB family antitoxin [Campylobacter helveticus]|uniref:Type II toxin-antitoxin system HicB family antitoxin n=1 Tax=Campylobacter helveticus TaxID=28898 RepID=A0AAX2UGG8_9BACT|nr:type II toxin-antitoxin system HicB family antitoxin [Campylobacter helveticus]ARE79788.1 putative toxin-antitoxin system, antitoxin component, HicB family [Campylobacter helveticus]MCR2039117.1 type II toxin-antitoxin system HicB family antitoxin [Campylobacter helveticus]MCR2055528.1 type II toxin-antitoxin system HicB family antitoxin [Campylobacter helveticus]MCR2059579.1 type II toxin-antitoxin system HicB family antitoxin [Campylobacter helveticus]MCR2062000.1 type II toxin-antitoxin 
MTLNAIIEKDDNGYFAYVPELKGCISEGNTYEEALANIKEASELYLESLQEEEIKTLQTKSISITSIQVKSPIQVGLNA